jgi:hypothetical protein
LGHAFSRTWARAEGRRIAGEPAPKSGSTGESQTQQLEDLAARQVAVDLAGDVALQDADDLVLGLALLDPAFEVELGLGIVSDADHDDAPERAVGLAVTTVVGLDLAVGLARPLRDGCNAAQVGPRTLRMQPLWVVAGRHHQCGRGVWSDSEDVEKLGDGGGEKYFDLLIELGEFVIERFGSGAPTRTATPWWPRSPDRVIASGGAWLPPRQGPALRGL